jgi:SAM-dependent methyltransferase
MKNIGHIFETCWRYLYSQEQWHTSPHFEAALAHRWNDFVFCERRTKTLLPFFKQFILDDQTHRAIDLAAGIGCEARWMAPLFRTYVANEMDREFRRQLKLVRDACGLQFTITKHDWLALKGTELQNFDLAILLGNSICLLQDERRVLLALKNVRSILRAGAKFIVDQRNFDYMLDQRHGILAHGFRYGGDVIYCGSSVVGRPIAISDHRVMFGYFDAASGARVGVLQFFPTRLDRLTVLLRRGGFLVDHIYSDLKPGLDMKADFFSYVCRAT